MKIAHLADIHLGELNGPIVAGMNARLLDTMKCMDYAVGKCFEEDVDLIVISGDLFNKSKLWADQMLTEIKIASEWLKGLALVAPTVLMFGTANHDSLEAFKNIKAMEIENLIVVTEPDLLNVCTNKGVVQVACVPGLDKGFYREQFPGMDFEDENKAISQALGNVILGVGADALEESPLILMSHYTVMGSATGNGESLFMNSDIVIPNEALEASKYDLVCLGHIHKAQQIPNCGRPVFYCGPVNAISFNEEGQDKGFWIHEIGKNPSMLNNPSKHVYGGSNFIKTPSREFETLMLDNSDIEAFIANGYENNVTVPPYVKDKIVRVIYSCSDELNKQFSKKSLEKLIYSMGAFFVSEIRPEKILATVDKKAMNENDTVEDNLRHYLNDKEVPEKSINEIVELVKPMISQVAASLPTGKLSGVFEPLRLEVRNYRSYLNEEFDFTKVSFATVNGPNGIGKSSFFMDAIADCLYEEPREGDLTGWISNGDDIKSGAMTFEFLMGSDRWRVIRTRVKSGKTTLTLQRYVETEWKDFSEDNKTQTQEKILNLLGMDALTFKSCALIMQDNYGVFLEADKTERMQVLSNILGLSIYDKLHDLAKNELKIQNKKVDILKNEIALLDEKLNYKNIYKDRLSSNNLEKKAILEVIEKEEKELKIIKTELDKSKEFQSKIKNVDEKFKALDLEIESKEDENIKFCKEKEKAQKIVDQEDKILAKIAEYEETKDNITLLKARKSLVDSKWNEISETNINITKNKTEEQTNDRKIGVLQVELKDKDILEAEVKSFDVLEKELDAMNRYEISIKELNDKKYRTEQNLARVENKRLTIKNIIEADILICEKKSKLIDDSNCPIENPTCNFLKDAIEAKNNITLLQDKLLKIDKSESLKLADELIELTNESLKLKASYDFTVHKDLKTKVLELKKKREQLLSLSGKDEILKNLLEQQAEIRKKLENLKSKLATSQDEYKMLQEEIADLPELEAAIPKLEQWYRGKDELPAAKERLKNSIERINALEIEISEKKVKLFGLSIDKNELIEELSLIKVTSLDLINKEEDLKISKKELNNIEISIGINLKKLDELQEIEIEKKSKNDEIEKLAYKVVKLNHLVKSFSIDGIPFQIVRSVVSELSSQANEILSQMTGGKMSIEMKMDKILKNKNEVNALEIWISDYQRGTMPYLSRSGGQKVKAALSVAFALADLKANRAGIQLGMMFIDEPPFLDGDGVQAYCDALELIHSRYPNMRVVAITHDEAMKARFPQNIDVIDSGDQGSKILFNN